MAALRRCWRGHVALPVPPYRPRPSRSPARAAYAAVGRPRHGSAKPQQRRAGAAPSPRRPPPRRCSRRTRFLVCALHGRPGSTTLDPHPARAGRPGERLSVERANFVRRLRPDWAGRPAHERQFFMLKPGKVRFEYDPPSPVDVVADGQSVVVRDRRLRPRTSIRCRRPRCASCCPTISTC